MGYLIVPDIKNEAVVCQEPCHHRDCAAMRLEWDSATCKDCGKLLLPGMLFYYTGVGTKAREREHQCVDCASKEAEFTTKEVK